MMDSTWHTHQRDSVTAGCRRRIKSSVPKDIKKGEIKRSAHDPNKETEVEANVGANNPS